MAHSTGVNLADSSSGTPSRTFYTNSRGKKLGINGMRNIKKNSTKSSKVN